MSNERSAFWRWRHARPFWGGLFVTLGGLEILLTVKAPLPVVLHVGMGGLAGFLVPILIALCGVLLLLSPVQRLFYSLVAAVLGLASWLTSNLGGFFIGLLLTLVGSALAFAWSPRKTPAGPAATPAQQPQPGPDQQPGEQQPPEQHPSLDELLNRQQPRQP
jgi:hypothetical protein